MAGELKGGFTELFNKARELYGQYESLRGDPEKNLGKLEEIKCQYSPLLEKLTKLAYPTSEKEDDALAAEAARGYSRICLSIGTEYCREFQKNPMLKDSVVQARNYLRDAMEVAVATNDPLKERIKSIYFSIGGAEKAEESRQTYGPLSVLSLDRCKNIFRKSSANKFEEQVKSDMQEVHPILQMFPSRETMKC